MSSWFSSQFSCVFTNSISPLTNCTFTPVRDCKVVILCHVAHWACFVLPARCWTIWPALRKIWIFVSPEKSRRSANTGHEKSARMHPLPPHLSHQLPFAAHLLFIVPVLFTCLHYSPGPFQHLSLTSAVWLPHLGDVYPSIRNTTWNKDFITLNWYILYKYFP